MPNIGNNWKLFITSNLISWKPDWKDVYRNTDYENQELKGILPQFTEGEKTFCGAYCWVRREGDSKEKVEYWSKIDDERIEKKDWEFYKKYFQPNEKIKILLDNYDRNQNWINNIEKDPFYEKVIL